MGDIGCSCCITPISQILEIEKFKPVENKGYSNVGNSSCKIKFVSCDGNTIASIVII